MHQVDVQTGILNPLTMARFVADGTRNGPTPAEIRKQLDRVLASAPFEHSQRMRQFLDYLIRQSLGDEPPRLKEFAIGVAVFGRDETFDPRIDAVVRVEAIRLRAKLREYYTDAGCDDTVKITIPKGGYIPHYEYAADAPGGESERVTTPGPSLSRNKVLFWTSACVIAATSYWLSLRTNATVVESPVVPPAASIAVLPLRDWNGNSGDYFSEALTDVLISKLSEREALRVTSIGSVMKYKNSDLSPQIIAGQLGVRSIVEGAVYRDSGEIRITANLIDARENRNVWSQSYNRPLENVLTIQDEIATAISDRLTGELLSVKQGPARDVNSQAYEAFLKGVYWRNRLTEQGFNRGILFFQQAIEMQPDFAEAYAAMAACHCRLAGHGIEVVRPEVALPQAKQLAMRALELDGSLAEAHAILGIISFKYDWDADAAKAFLNRALAENPSLFEAHLWLSQIAEGIGNPELAILHARNAHNLNPLSLVANFNLGWQLLQDGQLMEAEVEFDDLLQFQPEFWGGHWGKGYIYRQKKMHADAITEFSRAVELGGGHTMALASLGYTYAVAGMGEEALDVIVQLNAMAENGYVSPVDFATVYAGMNERDQAFAWLNEAFRVRARSLAWLTVRKEFDSLRDDPRYTELVSSVGVAADI